ncbi:MAG TPA: Hpt domain-containing protein, partial [Burkholderiales bacterium]|nr:Hpt domain-containing protein [Burkholderiales bacterium]
ELKSVLDQWLPLAHAAADATATPALSTAVTQQAVTAVPVDIRVLKELVGDNPAVIRELLREFRISAGTVAVELRAAYATGQITAIVAAAHKLKSPALAVGAIALAELCSKIEDESKAGEIDALAVLLPRFETEMGVVEQYLEKLLVTSPSRASSA